MLWVIAMTMARRYLVDSTVTPYYHCISRCVRRALLCGDGCEHRKQWIENRLKELAGIFAVDVAGFAVLDNHLQVVLQLNEAVAKGWTDEEVVRRWGRLFPPRGKDRQALEVTDAWVEFQLQNVKWVEETRRRLNSLGWFMKCLKEPLARLDHRRVRGMLGVVGGSDGAVSVVNSTGDQAPSSALRAPSPPRRGRRDSRKVMLG